MVAKNDITGDSIQTRGVTKAYQENIEKIFGDKSEEKERKAREKAEYFARLAAETKAKLEGTNTEEYDVPLTRYNAETQHVKEKLSN